MELHINFLPHDVRKRLRSGICITTPSQCVEELVLNSIDAGATSIAVRIDLDVYRIQVVDNGTGISFKDMDKAGVRYCTSKLNKLNDLDTNLVYYGFRGEAIASIVDMSGIVDITSRTKESDATYSKFFMHGKSQPVQYVSDKRPSSGTTITIQDFMYNFPVRRKLIKEALDLEYIRSSLEAIALIHPTISISLRNDKKNDKLLHTHKCKTIHETFCQLFDTNCSLCEIHYSEGNLKVSGYIGMQCHPTKALQFIYVNKRWLNQTKLHFFMNDLMNHSSIVRSRYELYNSKNNAAPSSPPKCLRAYGIFILNLECPLKDYDICLEPRKSLIEFKDWNLVLACLENMVLKFAKEKNIVISLDERFRKSEKALPVVESVPPTPSQIFLQNYSNNNNNHDYESCQITGNLTTSNIKHSIHGTLAKRECKKKHITSLYPEENLNNIVENSDFKPTYRSSIMDLKNMVIPNGKKSNIAKKTNLTVKSSVEELRLYHKQRQQEILKNAYTTPQELIFNITDIKAKTTTLNLQPSVINTKNNIPNINLRTEERGRNHRLETKTQSKPKSKKLGKVLSDMWKSSKANNREKYLDLPETAKKIETKKHFKVEEDQEFNFNPVITCSQDSDIRLKMSSALNEQSFSNDSIDGCLKNRKTNLFETSNFVDAYFEPPFIDKTDGFRYEVRETGESECIVFEGITEGMEMSNTEIAMTTENEVITVYPQKTSGNAATNEEDSKEILLTKGCEEISQTPFIIPNEINILQQNDKVNAQILQSSFHDECHLSETNKRKSDQSQMDGLHKKLKHPFPENVSNDPDVCLEEPNVHIDNFTDKTPKQEISVQNEELPTKSTLGIQQPQLDTNFEQRKISVRWDETISTNKEDQDTQNVDIEKKCDKNKYKNVWKEIKGMDGKIMFLNLISGNTTYEAPILEADNIANVKDDISQNLERANEMFHDKNIGPPLLDNLNKLNEKWNIIQSPALVLDSSILKSNALENSIVKMKMKTIKSHSSMQHYKFEKEMLKDCKIFKQIDKKFIAAAITYKTLEKGPNLKHNLIVLIDQHAADERIQLEKIINENFQIENLSENVREQFKSSDVIPPLQMQLSQEVVRMMDAFRMAFINIGLTFTKVDERHILFHSIPNCLIPQQQKEKKTRRCKQASYVVESTVKDLCHNLFTVGGGKTQISSSIASLPGPLVYILNTIACKAAVKFGDALTTEKCESMVNELSKCKLPFQCAHGRPTITPIMDLYSFQQNNKGKGKPHLQNLNRLLSKQ